VPSWSWASVDGSVQFIHGYQDLPGVIITCSLNTHTSQQLYEIRKRPLHVFGLIQKMPSIWCKHAARYYRGTEQQTLWISYPVSLRIYLDNVKALLSTSVLDRPDCLKQLLNLFFLFLGWKNGIGMYSAGLVLVQIEKLCFTFRQVGVFEGFPDRALRRGDTQR
jgi:hypothetical protein